MIISKNLYVSFADLENLCEKGLLSKEALASLETHKVDNDTHDGFHSFGELYKHRCVLTSVIFNQNKEFAWKSHKHFDEEDFPMFEGFFVCGIYIPDEKGNMVQATYHYKLEDWDRFDVPELDRAPKWDGHTPGISLERLEYLAKNPLK